jgi:hypothetical protein
MFFVHSRECPSGTQGTEYDEIEYGIATIQSLLVKNLRKRKSVICPVCDPDRMEMSPMPVRVESVHKNRRWDGIEIKCRGLTMWRSLTRVASRDALYYLVISRINLVIVNEHRDQTSCFPISVWREKITEENLSFLQQLAPRAMIDCKITSWKWNQVNIARRAGH